MTRRDKIGLAVLVGLFFFFILVLVWTVKPTPGNAKGPQDSIFVQQRIRNLQKSR